MNNRPQYRDFFPTSIAILVVVHVLDREQALRSVAAARAGGADGVFLIKYDGDSIGLRLIYGAIRAEHPELFVGINYLDLRPLGAARYMPPDANALWVDSPGVIQRHAIAAKPVRLPHVPRVGREIEDGFLDIRGHELPNALYFAGAAFKYQERHEGVSAADEARLVAPYCDVVTTSGPATGHAPDLQKILEMREALPPGKPFAIASGIDAGNVRQFAPLVDCVLLASAVTDPGERTNAERVRELVATAKS